MKRHIILFFLLTVLTRLVGQTLEAERLPDMNMPRTGHNVFYANGELTLFSQVNGVSVDSTPKLAKDTAWGNAETRYYVDCIRKNKEPLARPEEAVVIMKIITSLYKSAEKHKEVTIK